MLSPEMSLQAGPQARQDGGWVWKGKQETLLALSAKTAERPGLTLLRMQCRDHLLLPGHTSYEGGALPNPKGKPEHSNCHSPLREWSSGVPVFSSLPLQKCCDTRLRLVPSPHPPPGPQRTWP